VQECAQTSCPCNSSGVAIFGMRTVHADSCLNSEQIDTLFISVGVGKGFLGGGGVGGVSTFWYPPSRILLGHFPEIIIIHLESSAQAQSIGTLFE